MEWDFAAGFWRNDPPHRFGKIGWREEIEVRGDELGVRIHKKSSPKTPNGELELFLQSFGELHSEGCSFPQFSIDMDLSPMELNNLLNQEQTNP